MKKPLKPPYVKPTKGEPMKHLVFAALLIFALNPKTSANERGSGGYGVLLTNGKTVVLDLFEAGVYSSPYFDSTLTTNPLLLQQIQSSLPQFPELHNRLAQKLTEVEQISSTIAWSLAESFRLFNIRRVDSDFVKITDDDSVIDYDPKFLTPLSIRRGTSIFLNTRWWGDAPVDQKVALLLHEAVLAFQNFQEIKKVVGHDTAGKPIFETYLGQDGVSARAITGYLFTEDLKRLGLGGLARVLYSVSELHSLTEIKNFQIMNTINYSTSTFLFGKAPKIQIFGQNTWDYFDNSVEITYPYDLASVESSCNDDKIKSATYHAIIITPSFKIEMRKSPLHGLSVDTHRFKDNDSNSRKNCVKRVTDILNSFVGGVK